MRLAVTADDDGGLGGPGVEQEPETVSDFLGAGRGKLRQRVGLREPVQVRHGLLVEAEGPPDRLQDLRRRMSVAALLETRVVRAAHSRESGQFLPSQARSTPSAEVGNPGFPRVEKLPPAPQELTKGVVF